MKKETAEQRMAAILAKHNPEAHAQLVKAKKARETRKGNFQGVSEKEIDSFREIQGITYFLQAPELFTEKFCRRCRTPFLVSRMYVVYCSYDCIRNSILEDYGFEWTYHNDLDGAILKVYEGNQPIWITNLDTLKKCLTLLLQITEENKNSPSLETSNQDNISNSPPTTETSFSTSSTPTVTSFGKIPIPKL